MKQTGTDKERIAFMLEDCFWTGAYIAGSDPDGPVAPAQMRLTVKIYMEKLCEFLSIEFEDGEIVSIAGKEVA